MPPRYLAVGNRPLRKCSVRSPSARSLDPSALLARAKASGSGTHSAAEKTSVLGGGLALRAIGQRAEREDIASWRGVKLQQRPARERVRVLGNEFTVMALNLGDAGVVRAGDHPHRHVGKQLANNGAVAEGVGGHDSRIEADFGDDSAHVGAIVYGWIVAPAMIAAAKQERRARGPGGRRNLQPIRQRRRDRHADAFDFAPDSKSSATLARTRHGEFRLGGIVEAEIANLDTARLRGPRADRRQRLNKQSEAIAAAVGGVDQRSHLVVGQNDISRPLRVGQALQADVPRLPALDPRIMFRRQIERGDRRAGQTVDGGGRMILEQAVAPAAQFIGFDERDRLGEQQRGKILQRPAGIVRVSPARCEVGLIGGERHFESGRLTRILDFAAALSQLARDVDGLRIVQDLFAIGGIMIVGDANLLQPLLAAAVGGDNRPGARTFVAAVAE